MYSKILGVIFLVIGLYVLGGAVFSFTNPDYPGKKALITGGVQLALALFPLFLGVKLLKAKAVQNQEKN